MEQWLLNKGFHCDLGVEYIYKIWDYFIKIDLKSQSFVYGTNESRTHTTFKDFNHLVQLVADAARSIHTTIAYKVRNKLGQLI